MSAVYLVSCGGTKRYGTCQAQDLYVGGWFRAARRYVESTGRPWFILSAFYGLIRPDAWVSYYERRLDSMGVKSRHAWGWQIIQALPQLVTLKPGDVVTVLAGETYFAALDAAITNLALRPWKVERPLQGLGIGQQLAWLKRNTKIREASCG